jgi:hypothetical protein
MKPITLHPVSVLAGILLAGAIVVLAGAAQAPGGFQSIPVRDVRLIGEIPAEWWTFVQLDAGTAYTVPQDRWFVVTAATDSTLQVDGQVGAGDLGPVFYPQAQNGNGTRVSFGPGTLLEYPIGVVRLWGYLEPVR